MLRPVRLLRLSTRRTASRRSAPTRSRRLVVRVACAVGLLPILVAGTLGCSPEIEVDFEGPISEWPHWGGDPGASHHSPLSQITPENVDALEVAWVHRSGDFYDGSGYSKVTALQVTPIVVNDLLYYCTPFMRVFALDPETGEERWSFDPGLEQRHGEGPYPLVCRGVSYWEDGAQSEGACAKRIFYGTADAELIALDADTGRPCPGFGEQGRVALREGVGEAEGWEYAPTSPPQVIGDRVVVGAYIADNVRVDAPAGVVRAFDARSGRRVWAWDTAPPDWPGSGPAGEADFTPGTPNVWSIMTADAERGLVFVPTGNPSPDLYGGMRNGLDHYGSSTVALDASSGEVVWQWQSVHHDVWDYDTPSPPTLFQIPGVGNGAPAVAQSTKMGHVFLLDRETGLPLYPVEERPVPQGGAPGERLSPTQPFPTHPAPLHPLELEPEDAFGFTPIDRAYCRDLIERYRWDGIFTPPTIEGSIEMPHTAGGMNWGGVAIDPARGTLIVNQTHAAVVNKLIPREEYEAMDPSEYVYPNELYPMRGTPYAVWRFGLFSQFGAPCNPPPWGSLTAVDLRTGEVKWKKPYGTLRGAAPFPLWLVLRGYGSPNFGGGISTASGLYFIAATLDKAFRAIDVETGEELWSDRLPFMGAAVPLSYRLRESGRQFVVIAAGGNPITDMGDAIVAYALPEAD